MKEQVTIRLYEDPSVASCSHEGRFEPDGVTGWAMSTGETIPLTEKLGGRVFGIVETVEEEIHTDDEGRRYKLAILWTQD
ncbi:MAG: hypothetical protein AAGG38_08070 [Planctomycetota bacterium]